MLATLSAAPPAGILDQVLQQFLMALNNDYTSLENTAKTVLYYLAGIQIVISALWLMLKGDLQEAAVKTIQLFFTISVFYTLLIYGGTWVPQIINGFISAGSSASGISSISPSSIMGQGLSLSFAILDNFSGWGWATHPLGSLLSCFLVIGIVIVYAFIAAEAIIVLIKTYVLSTLSGLMFAFGANEVMRPVAMNYFKSVIGIGLQLLTFYLLLGVGVTIGNGWAASLAGAEKTHSLQPFLVIFAAIIVLALVIKNIPPFIAGLSGISGFRSYGGEGLAVGMMAAGMGAKAITAGAGVAGGAIQGTAQAARGVGQFAGNIRQGQQAGLSGGKAVGQAALNAIKSLGGAAKDSAMKDAPHRSFGQQFNARMSANRAQQAAKQAAPPSNFKSNEVDKP